MGKIEWSRLDFVEHFYKNDAPGNHKDLTEEINAIAELLLQLYLRIQKPIGEHISQ